MVGTRSALFLFLPLPRLGLVVLDEEHDESFKQDERLAYQAKEVAWFRVGQGRGLLVLGSATPDLKTFHAADSGAIPVVRLTQRVGGSRLPEVRLVDVSALSDPETSLAAPVLARLRETVDGGGQAMVMLNRRGYAPLMYCLDCGQTVRCPECHVGLTYHKRRERLVCHILRLDPGLSAALSVLRRSQLSAHGRGTERLEVQLRDLFPNRGDILRLDRDSARRQNAWRTSSAFRGRGGQGPGRHADAGQGPPLSQRDPGGGRRRRPGPESSGLPGRGAGLPAPGPGFGPGRRGDKPGEVLIQTRNPGLPFWGFVKAGIIRASKRREIALREKYRYPPFVKLALVRLSFPRRVGGGGPGLVLFGRAVREAAKPLGVTAMGPAPAPLARLRKPQALHTACSRPGTGPRRAICTPRSCRPIPACQDRLDLDLDPVNML